MDVRLLVHLEDGSDRSLVWWAEVPEVPRFSVASEELRDLISRAQWALADILADEGQELGGMKVVLVDDGPTTGNPVVSVTDEDHPSTTTGDPVDVASVTRSPVGTAA